MARSLQEHIRPANDLNMTLPAAMLFSFLQRHLIRGLTAGAVKG
jgi:ABC-type glycerol-3-phosphate transport system permease component